MARQREPLPRLNIPTSLNMQQPMQAMFSPALPTSIQQGFNAPLPMQTPMQPYFNMPPMSARPTHQSHMSMAQLHAANMRPGFPGTPMGGHFPRPSLQMNGPPSAHPFPGRNRRQLSIGGPPKAVLGGPNRNKLSPIPPPVAAQAPSPAPPPAKVRKTTVNLPKETLRAEDGSVLGPAPFARRPLDEPPIPPAPVVAPVETSSRQDFPSDAERYELPATIDVFLPGKSAWDAMKQMAIEEKLEKLGVERGPGSVPPIYAPHARAASISSPADPALLLFKLNKLQQSQHASASNSLSSSPAPFGMSPSPISAGGFMNRHGYSMSLAQPPTQSLYGFSNGSGTSLNPFGHDAILGSDQMPRRSPLASPGPPQAEIHAPQGRVPVAVSSLAPPSVASSVRSDSRPDFIRGFGLDITEEEEEEDEEELVTEDPQDDTDGGDATDEDQDTGTASQSRHHSRHASRLSAALSLRSFGVFNVDGLNERTDVESVGDEAQPLGVDKQDLDAVEEWTGSEDVFMGRESSDDESIGEWSNPSDEERARQQRVERRLRLKTSQQEDQQPRRIPNFPRPPDMQDDDLISNPSEEGQHDRDHFLGVHDFYDRPASNASNTRPLPPVPHSRVPSGQHSVHDPAQAHSRHPSDVNFGFSEPPAPRLNPKAKPFVFGAPRGASGSFTPESMSAHTHSRAASIGKPLNVAAPEFKPGSFTFTFPPANPIMPVAEPFRASVSEPFRSISMPVANPMMPASVSESYRPLPEPPVDQSSPFRVQGREKRRRQDSHDHDHHESMDEGDSFASFKFPPSHAPRVVSPSPRPALRSGHSSLNPSAEPFTFAGFSANANLPHIRPRAESSEEGDEAGEGEEYDTAPGSQMYDTAQGSQMYDTAADESMFTMPTASGRTKRAPIPLDFKHTVSNNTVPAGLFKALVNNPNPVEERRRSGPERRSGPDERTRRNVRSRMSSREVFEHLSRPSLDDLNVPAISHKVSRSRLVTDPGKQASPSDDVFGSTRHVHVRRRSSLPDALHSPTGSGSGSSMSEESSILPPAKDLTGRLEVSRLDETLAGLRRDVSAMNPMISEVVSLFRSQLRESAAKSMEDSQMDARGEMDFQMVRSVIEEGHAVVLERVKEELGVIARGLAGSQSQSQRGAVQGSGIGGGEMEQYSARTVSAINETLFEMTGRLEAIGRAAPARERDAIVDSVVTALSPHLRPEVVDYDFLTERLTQAVKPHISQLIDLASDKRETASLIVDRLIPLMPHPAAVDTDAISLQLVSAVTRAIAPIDAFEIKEQVADLVVERLDARLANRDKAFSAEGVASRVARLFEPLEGVPTALAALVEGQSGQGKVVEALEARLDKSQAELVAKLKGVEVGPDANVLQIKAVVEGLPEKHRALAEQTSALMDMHRDVLQKVTVLPEAFSVATHVLQEAHAEFTLSRDAVKRELDDLRKANTECQVQVAKARGAHGQVRVEKEVLSEKLNIVEADRDRLRAQVREMQDGASAKMEEATAVGARNVELQEALAKALARLQASDVASQANTTRIAELEKANQDLLFDKRTLKTKIDNLEMKVAYSTRDKELAENTITTLRKQNEELGSQSGQWDNLRQASEQLQMITGLMQKSDDEEVKELKRTRDRAQILEGEHSALQKRFKEQEARVSNSDKSAFTARQSLSQAQQRATEWEKRAKEYEGKLEMTRTELEQAEQIQAQLDADYQMTKMQLDEREANDRLTQDRESQLQNQITALETKIRVMQTEFEKARTLTPPVRAPVPTRNGFVNVHRPDSRASTAYDRSRSVTPNGQKPQTSVYDSIHAPKSHTNGNGVGVIGGLRHPPAAPSRYPSHLSRASPAARQQAFNAGRASPAPSNVSMAPTVDDDGWWS